MSRINISLSEEVQRRAAELITQDGYDGLSDLLKCLVRDEYRRVFPTTDKLAESPPRYGKASSDPVVQGVKEILEAGGDLARGATKPQPTPSGSTKHPTARSLKKKPRP